MKIRLTAFALLFTMLLTFLPVSAEFTDIAGMECEEYVKFLGTLGIVEGYTANEYAPDEPLSRAEMVTILLRTMNMYAPDYTGDVIFTDVDDEYWAYYEICAAHEMGFINGVGDGIFAPESSVTFNQAIKMLVNALGYSRIAEAKGGYPAGYLELARRLDLDDNVILGGEKEITRGEMAILVVNALNANVAEITSMSAYSDDYFEKISASGIPLIEYYLEIKRIEGRVNANYYQSIEGSLAPEENTIVLGDKVFCTGKSNIVDMIGEEAVVYIDDNSTKSRYPEVIFAFSEASEVKRLNSYTADYNTSDRALVYEDEEGVERKLRLSGVDVFVNGMEKTSLTGSEFSNADIKYIINPGSKLVLVDYYTDSVVKSTDIERELIYLTDGTTINPDNYNRMVIVNKNGKQLDISEIVKWNILSSQTISRNGESILKVVVCDDEAISGVISESTETGGVTELVIDEKTYRISPSVTGTVPSVGKNIKFYVNQFGQIACVPDDIPDYFYGYVKAIKPSSFEEKAQIRIFTHEGEFKIFTLSDNLKINDSPVNPKDIETNTDFYTNGSFNEQLVRYEAGANDVVKSITTCSESIVSSSNRQNFGINAHFSESRWLGTFSTKYTVDSDTLYFSVPGYANPEDKAYKINPIKSLTKFTTTVRNAYFYDIDEDNVIGVILSVVDTTTGDGFDFKGGSEVISYGVVSSKKNIYDAEKGELKALTIINGKKATETVIINEQDSPIRMTINANAGCSVITNSDDPCYGDVNISYDDIDIGDIMIFRKDENGVAYDSQMLVRRKYPKVYESLSIENPSETYSETGYYEWSSSIIDHISDVGIIADTYIYSGGPYERLYLTAPAVMEYDSTKDKINLISWDSLQEGERFSTCDWSIYPSIVLVYR